jgi:hypothetical protein
MPVALFGASRRSQVVRTGLIDQWQMTASLLVLTALLIAMTGFTALSGSGMYVDALSLLAPAVLGMVSARLRLHRLAAVFSVMGACLYACGFWWVAYAIGTNLLIVGPAALLEATLIGALFGSAAWSASRAGHALWQGPSAARHLAAGTVPRALPESIPPAS